MSANSARQYWDQYGIALLRCDALFAAVRISADLVHAAAGSSDTETVREYLAAALLGGPVFLDQHCARYYALVPMGTVHREEWHDGRHKPHAECLGPDSYVGVPRPDIDTPDQHFSHWCVPMHRPGDLCDADAVSQLVSYGRHLLVMAGGAVSNRIAPADAETIKAACQRVLWNMTPYGPGEAEKLVEDIEKYVRQLSPQVDALTPTLDSERQGAALHTLRYADDVLDPAASKENQEARLHDLAVVARSLLTMVEMAAAGGMKGAPDGAAVGYR
ncbi:hypothetical protein [Streptomyces sp. NPDC001165]|uniref:hypothetical protein n=1 Tax=Streptomyces sp. NPDC001165 TaxID=3364546 RepID=UPI003680E0B5